MKLKNAKVIITGGSSGIGKATAQLLSEAGATVLITGRDEQKLKNVAAELNVFYHAFDIADLASLKKNATEIISKLNGVDVLINNAGVGEFALLGEITAEQFHRVFSTNIVGLTLFTQEFLPIFKEQQSGNILNIASTAALKGFARGSVYSASKFALRSLTQCWQAELRKDNIRVIGINPSEVTTAFNNSERQEREEQPSKLRSLEIAHTIKSTLEMDNRGFIPEVSVWATNP
ncbi:MAG: short-chain dehydrogenase [Bacteroidetes bacterium HGW-Bacteroidetes-12]|nr:MAG: short-chain dehydrogenase [Bacteroidetes bacterium HGW-Bacteroidetes-12]